MHMERKHTLIDNAAEKRYELDLGDGMALAEYVLGHGLIVLTHTEVPPEVRRSGHRQGAGAGRAGGHPQKEAQGRPPMPVRRDLYPPPPRMDGLGADRRKQVGPGRFSPPPQPPARRERPAAKPDSFRRVRFCLLPTGIFPLNKYRYSLFPKNFRLEIWFIL